MSALPIESLDVSGKAVFCRLDLNVPLTQAGDEWLVEDDSRIVEALPTVRFLIEKKARLILASHLGRPDGKRRPEFSLEPVAKRLAELLPQEVTLADDCIGEGIELMALGLKPGEVLLLENLRFHAEEEKNDPEFSRRLSRLAPIYVTDAFGTAHRKHASTYGLPSILQVKGMGFLIQKELRFLDRILKNPERPFLLLLGGAKVSDKIQAIVNLMGTVDGILVGGAMAYAFYSSIGMEIPDGARQPSPDDIKSAKAIFDSAKNRGIRLLLPEDTVDGFDIGPRTRAKFKQAIAGARTLFWNGPMGWFEKPGYEKGTFEIAEFIADLQALKVVGGGDTVSAIKKSGFAGGFDHLSTGGGASLEYLEGKGLPGIEVLEK